MPPRPGHRPPRTSKLCSVALGLVLLPASLRGATPEAAPLPPGVVAEWNLDHAWHDTTATRERICLNGLWRWQPGAPDAAAVPAGRWGWFKVPGSWPGITDYLQKDSQAVIPHADWRDPRMASLRSAWYEREFTVPATWSGRRIAVRLESLNSLAAVFVDGRPAGDVRFPGGELDLTAACRPGATHRLSLLVSALPLQGVMLAYTDTAAAREVQGRVERRGLCGDVWLEGVPAGPRFSGVRVETSVRRRELLLDVALTDLPPGSPTTFRAVISRDGRPVHQFTRRLDDVEPAGPGRLRVRESWIAPELWDLHTPQHQYDLEISLLSPDGTVLDTLWKERFGFRELWIDGRDFRLNGSRIFLSALPLDNAQVGAAQATYAAARESLARLRTLGINLVYTHNYGCEPGAHLAFGEILRAADDTGMLVSFSQPHFSHYAWPSPEADRTNGYAAHAAFYVGAAGNHPSVVLYAMSHNATGYNEDMNPDLIDGVHEVRDSWARRNVALATRAEALVRGIDPGRPIYHHASGNLGPMHVVNFYPNFVPVQEMSDWFGHWATAGVKPLFLCEYGAPFTWDWAMYRGWYRGKREFGSAVVPWEFCLAEWNAQFLGDRAFDISDREKRNLRWEAEQFRAGRTWHRWDYPHQLGSADFPERDPVLARYYEENWRAFRTWGVSVTSPWEHHILFRMRPGLDRNRRTPLPVDWSALQRPGFSPDFLAERHERMDLAYERSDWIPTEAAQALIRNNGPLASWIAGAPDRFTARDHHFHPAGTVEKQLIVLNNSRRTVEARCTWRAPGASPESGETNITLPTGEQVRLPIRFVVPSGPAPSSLPIEARVAFSTGEVQTDRFLLHVLPPRPAPAPATRIALFDPPGQTAALLSGWGLAFDRVAADAPLSASDLLVIGKGALTPEGPAPDLDRVKDGLRVLVFEQTAAALEGRLGFRTAEYGLRTVFPRIPDHPALAGLEPAHLENWRGEATLSTPRLEYELSPKYNGAPTVTWCGLTVPRAWRCGCLGNVASVLIEKPARGDFLPILDGGFSLQYSPLLEYREGSGLVVFCQMDVTGRTEPDPAAATLAANLLDYVNTWKPQPGRVATYVGEAAGRMHLERSGLPLAAWDPDAPAASRVLVIGPGAAGLPGPRPEEVARFLASGGRVLTLGATAPDLEAFLPFPVQLTNAEHLNAFFEAPAFATALAGIGPADVHNRAPRALPLVSAGARPLGNGVLAASDQAAVVFCALTPWSFADPANYGLKRTFRRSSSLVSRLLGNLGVRAAPPLLSRFGSAVGSGQPGRWLSGLYLDTPEEWDDPYRFFRW